MVSMSFNLKLNRPVSSVECIYPDSFVLSIRGMTFIERMVEFDFKVYNFRIVDGYNVECEGVALNVEAFPLSERLMMMLSERKALKWNGVFIHCGSDPEYGEKIEPIGIYNVILSDKKHKMFYNLPDYEWRQPSSKSLSKPEMSVITGAMDNLVCFCKEHFYDSDDDIIRLYESNNRIYVRTSSGLGYFYDIGSDVIGTIGVNVHEGLIAKAKELLTNAISVLSDAVPFPVNCISVPLKPVTGGRCYSSKRESCAFDIILE